jgi:hypothetical protein
MDGWVNGNDIYEYIKMRCQLDSRISLGELMTRYDDPLFVVSEVDELEKSGLIKRDYAEDVEIFYTVIQ